MAESLRTRLAAKAPRRIVFPVQVSDPGKATEFVAEAEQKLKWLNVTALTVDDKAKHEEAIRAAEENVADARAALAEHFLDVEFQAGHPADVERILADNADDKGQWNVKALPALAALSVVDPELQDAEWWQAQFEGLWSLGERDTLWAVLIDLNASAPPTSVPKG